MMGRQDKQLKMILLDLSSMVPENHLLRIIKEHIDFDFIYDHVKDRYSTIGRPSIDPVLLIKMLLVGYLYGIKSERRLEEEINLNIAYRWFCDLDLDQRVPDHSTFSQNRRRRFQDGQLFEDLWVGILQQIIQLNLLKGDIIACDGTYLPIQVSSKSLVDQEYSIRKGMISYLDLLDQELQEQAGFREYEPEEETKTGKISRTDPEARWITHGNKVGLGYLMQTSTDCSTGIITGVDIYPANQKESSVVLRHLDKQIKNGVPIRRAVLDRGYDVGAVHRGLELLGIEGWIASIEFPNTADKKGMIYQPEKDVFICPNQKSLPFHHLVCQKSTGKYLRCYQASRVDCDACSRRQECLGKGVRRRRILASGYYPAFYRGRKRMQENPDQARYYLKLRQIWIEGRFSVLKREHKLSRLQKRGLIKAKEECILACLANNLKKVADIMTSRSFMAIYFLPNYRPSRKYRQPSVSFALQS